MSTRIYVALEIPGEPIESYALLKETLRDLPEDWAFDVVVDQWYTVEGEGEDRREVRLPQSAIEAVMSPPEEHLNLVRKAIQWLRDGKGPTLLALDALPRVDEWLGNAAGGMTSTQWANYLERTYDLVGEEPK